MKKVILFLAQRECSVIIYYNFKVKMKNYKYKIKTIKSFYFNVSGIEIVKTYNDNWKNILIAKIYGDYTATDIGDFKIYCAIE